MGYDEDSDLPVRRNAWSIGDTGIGMLRFALLFGSAAVALALIVAPIAERESRAFVAGPQGIDMITTSSTGNRGTYTERRSVLQAMPESVCTIRANGARSGDC
jgi:hypothetical protein